MKTENRKDETEIETRGRKDACKRDEKIRNYTSEGEATRKKEREKNEKRRVARYQVQEWLPVVNT